ncbi:MAG: class I SAM-dependent methyltransferase [Planctomycetes bacterium]|nr:class I SAM-dependent methyltransferase [Planctomycetota bacterium]
MPTDAGLPPLGFKAAPGGCAVEHVTAAAVAIERSSHGTRSRVVWQPWYSRRRSRASGESADTMDAPAGMGWRLVKQALDRVGLLRPLSRSYHLWRARPFAAYPVVADGLPLPPPELMMLVGGDGDAAGFLETGRGIAAAIEDVLGRAGLRLDRFTAVLDFGCGCGRVLRHWSSVRGPCFHGSDVDSRLIAWCRDNLPHVSCRVNAAAPPLDCPAAAFDFVVLFSVFTHLPRAAQQAWLTELARVLQPGGHLLLTTHGEHYAADLTAAERACFMAGELVVRFPNAAGSNACAAYHPEAAILALAAERFEVRAFVPARFGQDFSLLQRRADSRP